MHEDTWTASPPPNSPCPSCLLTRGGPPKVLEKHDHRLPEKPLVTRLALMVVEEGSCVCLCVRRDRKELDSRQQEGG